MKAARWLVGLATVSAFSGAMVAGCGGGTNGSTPIDSGSDVTEDTGTPETSTPEAAPEAAPMDSGPGMCVPDASIETLMLADASLGDSGATVATCFACVKQQCPAVIAQCDQSCTCVQDFEQLNLCLGAGSPPLTCLTSLATGIPGIDASTSCALPCAPLCGISFGGGDGGSEGGKVDSGTKDGGTKDASKG